MNHKIIMQKMMNEMGRMNSVNNFQRFPLTAKIMQDAKFNTNEMKLTVTFWKNSKMYRYNR